MTASGAAAMSAAGVSKYGSATERLASQTASAEFAGSKSTLIEPPVPQSAPVSRARIDEGDSVVQPRRPLMPLALAAVVLIAVVWGGIRLFGAKPTSEPVADVASERSDASAGEQSTAGTAEQSTPSERTAGAPPSNAKVASANVPAGAKRPGNKQVSGNANPRATTNAKMPANAKVASNSKRATNTKAAANARASAGTTGAQSAGIQEVIPDVPQRARRTIRGNVRVSIRVIVEQDGTVFAALTEQRGPSRYFERLAIEAAKKWTFPPNASTGQRLMLVKFAFNREGTTAEAVPL